MKKKFGLISLLLAIIATIACDPGLVIRQRSTDPMSIKKNTTTESSLIVNVKESVKLIGETWYVPEVTLINNYVSNITINRFELSTTKRIFQTSKKYEGKLPQVLETGATISLDPWFDLEEPIYEVISKPVELKLYYDLAGKALVSSVQLERGTIK